MTYEDAFQRLNDAQKQAVTTTEGPVLVIAGPGTGKTQLLTTRTAHILKTTDTLPQNILCLTFTESAAHTMRERLVDMIGADAHDVAISTYHAFGSDLIRRFPDFFVELAEREPVDDLDADQILRDIIGRLPYSSPLKFADNYIGDVKTFISNAKQATLSPDNLRRIADHNEAFLEKAAPLVAEILEGMARVDKKSAERFVRLAERLAGIADTTQPTETVLPLSTLMLRELHLALEEFDETGKTPPLTKWKLSWIAKDADGAFTTSGQAIAHKMRAAAYVYQAYQDELAQRNLYDFDDMVLRAVQALEDHAELRYNLQEQYLYIMLDEFQDTNGAQLRLVELLTDNPVHEGRPNVLAVGDDDQAIYAFQGADHSHMLQFSEMCRNVTTVALTKNYRSHADILHTAQGIAAQIDERLSHRFEHIDKTLTAENTTLPKRSVVQRREAASEVGMYAWTAKQIARLLQAGTPAHDIAVLAPKHKYLEPLVPFLRQADVPVRYEKRENVLEDPAINQLVRMSQLVLLLAAKDSNGTNALWAEVLSFDFWQLPTSLVWQLSWQASDDDQSWTDVLLANEQLKPIALFFIRLSMHIRDETCERMLDYLIGAAAVDLQEPGMAPYTSPFYEYHFGASARQSSLGTFWQLLANLTVLRARVHEHRRSAGPLYLSDFVRFIEAHLQAGVKILSTNPYQDADDSVQLMTAFKAKGQEFAAVFLLSVQDDAWGNATRGQGSRMSLPQNLQHIRYAGMNQNERLRLLFVAITRAKSQLYLLNHRSDFTGKQRARLACLNETTDETGNTVSPLLPEGQQQVLTAEEAGSIPASAELGAYWQQRHTAALGRQDLRNLLQERLSRFRLSPTHVGSFTDLQQQGPEYFLRTTLLRFPSAPIPAGAFGNAIHETLQWLHLYNRRNQNLPSEQITHRFFAKRLQAQALNVQQTEQFLVRGQEALSAYLAQRGHTVQPQNEHEYNFRNEGVFIGEAHMGGKIDKLIIDRAQKTIQIVDFKTGKSSAKWYHDPKLHRYRQQLYLYKALVEGSHTFAGYRVTDAFLEFVEPDEQGNITELHLHFNDQDEQAVRQLAEAIWRRVQALDLPDVSKYSQDMAGVEAFERDLINED